MPYILKLQVARIVLKDDDKNLVSYLEKATQAARELERAKSIGDKLPAEALQLLGRFEELLCKPLEASLEIFEAAVTKSLELASAVASVFAPPELVSDVARASAGLGLAADYCEHAAETLERARQLALSSANRLVKEVPTKVATWRGELQSKATVKADAPKVTSSGGYSLLFGSKKAPAKAEPNKDVAGVPPSEEILKVATEDDSSQRTKVGNLVFVLKL